MVYACAYVAAGTHACVTPYTHTRDPIHMHHDAIDSAGSPTDQGSEPLEVGTDFTGDIIDAGRERRKLTR